MSYVLKGLKSGILKMWVMANYLLKTHVNHMWPVFLDYMGRTVLEKQL